MTIVLAHGVLGFDLFDFGLFGRVEYFNGVKDHLEDEFGREVLAARVSPVGNVSDRGTRLADRVMRKFKDRKSVIVLAHSMGGLDTRWALRHVPGFKEVVKTVVTIGTPHFGSPVADAIASGDPAILRQIPLPIRVGLSQAAVDDLTTKGARSLDIADVEGVTYHAIAGDVTRKNARSSNAFLAVQTIFGLNTPNDGVVTVHSATRGAAKVTDDDVWPVDHAGLVGWNLDFPVSALFGGNSLLHRYTALARKFL